MNAQYWIIQSFNGISYGALLFLVGAGLSLIFGVMRIVNLAHGSFFLWGGYIALSVIAGTDSWALSLPLAALAVAIIGIATERLFLRSEGLAFVRTAVIAVGVGFVVSLAISAKWPTLIGGGELQLFALAAAASGISYLVFSRLPIVPIESDVLRQVLLTVGFAYLFQQGALDIWGGNNLSIDPPDALGASILFAGIHFPLYRIFMIAMALFIGVAIWLAMEKTRMGAAVRATVDDAQMARGIGIDTNRISMLIFALGAFLAALGGVIGGAFLGVYPGLDFEMLPLAFAVVIIGGMGSLGGAAVGALLVGLADNFGKALFPELSYFTLYAPMVLILAVKPTGLFGRE